MSQIITYLTFNGNCREAMEFYRQCLGGELNFQLLEESPLADNLPKPFNHFVLQATLKQKEFILMASDMTDAEILKGNSVSILLNCENRNKLKTYYQNLALGGRQTQPLQETGYGDLFGGLTDKYGNHWLFHCKRKHNIHNIQIQKQ